MPRGTRRDRSAPSAAGSATSSPATASGCGPGCRGYQLRQPVLTPCPSAAPGPRRCSARPRPSRTSTVLAPRERISRSAPGHERELGLEHVDHRAVPEPQCFGPSRMNRFGKPGTVQPRCARGLPSQTSASVRPSRPRTIWPTGMSTTWKPVPKTIASTLALGPVRGHHRALADLGHRAGDELDVVARERRVPVVGRQDALATEPVVGRRLRHQLRRQAARHVAARDALEQPHRGRALDEAEHELARALV